MKERPIIFSGPMVRAILDGRKTQTRRVYKAAKGYPVQDGEHTGNPSEASTWMEWGPCPYGAPGDRLWVRETFQPNMRCGGYLYRADDIAGHIAEDWRPSIYMPRWASRITLEIEAVRVERVQDITEEDARAEGIVIWEVDRIQRGDRGGREDFRELWDSINSKRGFGWATNTWVRVIQFKRVEGGQP